MVAAGAVITPGKTVPSGEVWAGNPAKMLRKLEEEETGFIAQAANDYAALAAVHAAENAKTPEEIQVDTPQHHTWRRYISACLSTAVDHDLTSLAQLALLPCASSLVSSSERLLCGADLREQCACNEQLAAGPASGHHPNPNHARVPPKCSAYQSDACPMSGSSLTPKHVLGRGGV